MAVADADRRRFQIFSASLGFGVLLARVLTSGPPYFADAYRNLTAIADHTYVIQPPGYWLFLRTAGLFPNAELAIHIMNWCFSALGCVMFYACARRLVRSPLAELGALFYATVFFAWFSGNVHSTYASQLLFPPLTFYCMLRYREDKRTLWVCAVAVSFALGAGIRPSDGAFMVPLLLLFFFQLRRKQQILLGLLTIALCTAWFVPTKIAQMRYLPDRESATSWLGYMASNSVLLGKFNVYTFSGALRFFLPMALALGPAAVFLLRARNLWLWTWVLPGSLFFLLVFISDATYLNCVLGGYILLCLVGMATYQNRRAAIAVLASSILINLVFYSGFRPLRSQSHFYAIMEKDLGNYTLYAVKHKFFVERLKLKSLEFRGRIP
jgi:4-amino-4-deoxy-L-arabinose transferase-like glycosyltransferase